MLRFFRLSDWHVEWANVGVDRPNGCLNNGPRYRRKPKVERSGSSAPRHGNACRKRSSGVGGLVGKPRLNERRLGLDIRASTTAETGSLAFQSTRFKRCGL